MSPKSTRLDRDEELEIFEKMLSGEVEDRILLIHADGGMGKSHLLREFSSKCREKVIHAGIEFKEGNSVSLSELLSRLCDSLGWDHFTNLSTHLKDFIQQAPTVNITGNTLLGRNEIAIDQALSAPDEETREGKRVALTDAFFADLRNLPATVLIFDAYNHCDQLVAKWLSGSFLARVSHSTNVIVIIAGRQVPETSLDWHAMCHQLVLKGIDSKYYEDFARAEGIEVHPERIRGLCDAFDGRPLPILNQLKAYSLRGQAK